MLVETCCGLQRTVILLMICIPCFTVAAECAPSGNNGSRAMIVGGLRTDNYKRAT